MAKKRMSAALRKRIGAKVRATCKARKAEQARIAAERAAVVHTLREVVHKGPDNAVTDSSRANDRQVGGTHYKGKGIEPWDFAVANGMPFLEGSIIKYVTRWRDKNGIQDLHKAQHYLQKLIEVSTEE